MTSPAADRATGRATGWAAILAVVAVVLVTVVGGYLVVQSRLQEPLDPAATVRAYVAALSESDCAELAELSTTSHLNGTYCPPSYASDDLRDYRLEVSQVHVREQSSTTASLLADVTVMHLPDGSSFTTAVVFTLISDGDRWFVDEGRDPRPVGDRSLRLG